MKPFETFTSVVAPLPAPNIDTDQIIPARFLLRSRRSDYSSLLFHDRRFNSDGSEISDFVLNRPEWQRAGILISGANFGCGSAREQAVWALADFGIRTILAPSFGSIFYGNCIRNGILAACVNEERMAPLWRLADDAGSAVIDLERRIVSCGGSQDIPFEIPDADRRRLLDGLDDIDITLRYSEDIISFETQHADKRPWANTIRKL